MLFVAIRTNGYQVNVTQVHIFASSRKDVLNKDNYYRYSTVAEILSKKRKIEFILFQIESVSSFLRL